MNTPKPPEVEPTPEDRDERELADAYRQLPRHEPDAALDARILGAAERAVARPQRRRVGWVLGLGSAAGLVMAAGLTWHLVGYGPANRPATAPTAKNAETAGAARQVVPVHVLSAKKAASEQAGQARYSAADAMAPPPPPPPPPPVLATRATSAPGTAQDLIAQARTALADEDAGRARFLVERIVRQYPDVKLPADLAPYAPNESSGKGSP